MKIIRKRPGQPWEFADIENTLEALQAEVEGYIETVTLCSDVCLIANEEGLIKRMPFNTHFAGCPWFGTLLLVGVNGDEFCDVPDGLLNILGQ